MLTQSETQSQDNGSHNGLTLVIRGKEYQVSNLSKMQLTPMKTFTEDPSKVAGWEGLAYSLAKLFDFDPPLPKSLAWYSHFYDENGRENKDYGVRLSEDEIFYIIDRFFEFLGLNIEPPKPQGFTPRKSSKSDIEAEKNNLRKRLQELEQS